MGDFAREAGKLKDYSQRAYDDFMARDPHTFCKSHFKCHSQCDSVDNNMSETFNSFILLARYKPIISMLEDIRLAIMDRMQIKRKLITQFVGGIAPRISKKIKEGYQEQLHCQTRWSGTNDYIGFEIHHRGIGHEVNLGENTCSCRVWDLTGIPCPHAISAILFMRKNPEDFVAHWYKSEAYINAYESLLNPVQGTKFWDLQQEGSVLPPHSIRKPMGRPKHARRRDPTEGPRNQFKASRRGVQGRCTHCESSEHTRRKCPTAPPRQQATQESQGTRVDEGPSQVRKKGRPKGSLSKIRCGDMPPSNAPTPASIILGRRSKAPTTSAESGRGRGGGGRGRGRGRRPSQLRMPEGFGLWQGPQGEMAFRAPGDSHVNVIHLTPNAPSSQSAPSQE